MTHFKRALVTGASSGIGEAVCRLLAKKGIPLLITGRNKEKLDAVANDLRKFVEVESFTADLNQSSQRALVIDKIHQYIPDLVINNAGFGFYGDILTHETSKQMDIFNVDAGSVLQLSIEAARALISAEKKGVILNVSSAAAFQVFPSLAVYAASKAFVNSFSEAFDVELQPYGIRVLASCPGVVTTHFRERAAEETSSSNPNDPLSMTQEFAAEEIWKQILNGKPVHIFNWKYRLLTFVSGLLPKRLLMKLLRKSIQERHKSRSVIKEKK